MLPEVLSNANGQYQVADGSQRRTGFCPLCILTDYATGLKPKNKVEDNEKRQAKLVRLILTYWHFY